MAFLLILIALLAALPAPFAAAQDPAVLRPQEASLQLQPGQTATVTILLEDARDVYAIDIRGRFDPAVVEVIDAEANRDGTQMGMGFFPVPEFVARNAADNAAGTLQYAITQVNPTPPAFGQGIVMTIALRGKATGTTALAFDTVEMADRNGILLPVTAQPLAITVGNPGPTPTNIALAPPTEPAPAATDTPAATTAPLANATGATTALPATPAPDAPAADPPPGATALATAEPGQPAPAEAAPGDPSTAATPAPLTAGAPDNAPAASGGGESVAPPAEGQPAPGDTPAPGAPTAAGEAVAAVPQATTAAAVIGSGQTIAQQEAGSAEAETNSQDARSSSGLWLVIAAAAALAVTVTILVRQRSR